MQLEQAVVGQASIWGGNADNAVRRRSRQGDFHDMPDRCHNPGGVASLLLQRRSIAPGNRGAAAVNLGITLINHRGQSKGLLYRSWLVAVGVLALGRLRFSMMAAFFSIPAGLRTFINRDFGAFAGDVIQYRARIHPQRAACHNAAVVVINPLAVDRQIASGNDLARIALFDLCFGNGALVLVLVKLIVDAAIRHDGIVYVVLIRVRGIHFSPVVAGCCAL